MNPHAPFLASDLEELDARLYSRAAAVVPMRDVYQGVTQADVLAVRHDVDDNQGSLDTALALAHWEYQRDYRSTFYLLHDAHYWGDVRDAARELVQLNHEVGIHVNALGEAIRQGRKDTHTILVDALRELRCAVPVIGAVAHGDPLCHEHHFVNDEAVFTECERGGYEPGREVAGVKLEPRSMRDYGLEYDANWLPRTQYLSDSGGRWSQPFDAVADGFPYSGQLHMLVHPDWWTESFVAVAA